MSLTLSMPTLTTWYRHVLLEGARDKLKLSAQYFLNTVH